MADLEPRESSDVCDEVVEGNPKVRKTKVIFKQQGTMDNNVMVTSLVGSG